MSEPLDPRDAIKSALHRVLVQDRFNSEWGSAAAALEALDALAAEVRQLREALEQIAVDGTAPVWIRDFARFASTTGSGAQAAPPEKP